MRRRKRGKGQGSRVKVANLNKKYIINEPFVERIVKDILRILDGGCELEIVFLDNKAIKVLNKKYRKSDRPTDVLSFGIDIKGFEGKGFLGEIFISLDQALENSVEFGTDFTDEIALYITHGILHLYGYDDETVRDRVRMSKKESQILRYLCRKENLSRVLMPR